MFTHCRIAVVVCLITASRVLAQDASTKAAEPIELKDLRTPASPAFSLLGIAPTDVERPSTPRAFALSVVSALQKGGDTLLPNNFALEVAPYWLTGHPNLEFDQYVNPTVGQSIRQTFSVSVATSKASASSAKDAPNLTDIAIGIRVSPWSGKTNSDVARLKAAIVASSTRAALIEDLRGLSSINNPTRPLPEQLSKRLAEFRAGGHDGLTDSEHGHMLDEIETALKLAIGVDEANLRAALLKLRTDGDAARKSAALQLQQANQQRTGFSLDFAAATVTRATDDIASDARVTRTGIWLTTGFSDPHVAILGLLRYQRNSDDPAVPIDLVDTGFRAIGSSGNLTVSFEGIHRMNRSSLRASDSTERAVVNIEYKVSEDVTLTSTFGRDYGDTRLGRNGAVIGLLGLSFGLGKPVLPVKGM